MNPIFKICNSIPRIGLFIIGCACLFFSIIPAIIYRIGHSGVILLFLGGCSLLLLTFYWTLMPAPLLRVFCVLLGMVVLLCGTISAMMAKQAFFSPPGNGAATVIVLGGKVNGNQPSLMLSRRLFAAETYLRENPQAMCVVSGGQGPDELFPEALVMAQWLEDRGIAPERILREALSTNTEENLSFSAAMLDNPDEIIIATDGFHQLRASIYASALGLQACSLPAKTPWGLLPSYWVREWLGLPVAWLKLYNVI